MLSNHSVFQTSTLHLPLSSSPLPLPFINISPSTTVNFYDYFDHTSHGQNHNHNNRRHPHDNNHNNHNHFQQQQQQQQQQNNHPFLLQQPPPQPDNITDQHHNLTNYTDDYIKKYLEEKMGPKHKSLGESVMLTIIYSLIFVSGIVGNVCTGVIVARRPDMRTTTNFYLCSLAVSDVITLAVGLPQEMYHIWIAYPNIFGTPYCLLTTYLLDMTSSASVFTITAFTVERYFAIKYPLMAHTSDQRCRRVPGVICLIWLLATVLAIPFPMHTELVYAVTYPDTDIPIPDSRICAREQGYEEYYKNLLLFSFICLFVIPIFIITILYTLIAIAINKSAKTRSFNRRPDSYGNSNSLNSSNTTSSQSHKAIVKMLIAVVVAFFFCWAPFHAQRIMTSFIETWTSVALSIHNGIFYVSGIFYYFACTVNPILYNLMSRKYRQAFKETLCINCCRGKSRFEPTRTSGLYNRNLSNHVVLYNRHHNTINQHSNKQFNKLTHLNGMGEHSSSLVVREGNNNNNNNNNSRSAVH